MLKCNAPSALKSFKTPTRLPEDPIYQSIKREPQRTVFRKYVINEEKNA